MTMFTTPCFIRKNSRGLRDKVYRLGYRSGEHLWDSSYNTLLVADKYTFRCYDDEWENADNLVKKGYIDCGVNEDLFLSISALNDNTDKNQWFTDGYHWEKCSDDNANIHSWIEKYKDTPHKATVEELKEYLKTMIMDKKKLYISLPITGFPIEAVKERANQVKDYFLDIGYDVITPFDVCDDPDKPYSYYIGKDIEALLECDSICFVSGWQKSKGCMAEFEIARIYGIEMI